MLSSTRRWFKVAMVKSFRLSDVVQQCSTEDCLFARKLPNGGCQFFAWPGLSHEMAAQGILSMPAHLQTVHSVFGRLDVPMDICADVDCAVPDSLRSVDQVKRFQRDILRRHVQAIHKAIEADGEKIATQVCLQSPNLKKASFHIHVRLLDTAFADYRSLLAFMQQVKENHDAPNLDIQIYRPNGMLRMHKSKKENLQSAMVILDDPSFHLGFTGSSSDSGVRLTDAVALEHSFCIRSAATFRKTIRRQPKDWMSRLDNQAAAGTPADGAFASRAPTSSSGDRFEARAPRTAVEACRNVKLWLHEMPPESIDQWKHWIAVGLNTFRVANHFADARVEEFEKPVMDELLDAWIFASKKVPQKFTAGTCEKMWAGFRPDSKFDGWWQSYRALCRFANGRL